MLRHVLMWSAQTMDVKRLSGFVKKSHRVPDHAGDFARTFVAKITADEVQDDVSAIAKAARSQFGYTRADIKAVAEPGLGTVVTPAFEYTLSVALNESNPSEVIWRREIRNVKPDAWGSPALDGLFSSAFDTLELELADCIVIEDVIDRIEAMKSDKVKVDYDDTDLSHCQIVIKGFAGRIELTKQSLKIRATQTTAPSILLNHFKLAQKLLAEGTGGNVAWLELPGSA